MWVDFDVSGEQEMDFFTGGSIILEYGHILAMIAAIKW